MEQFATLSRRSAIHALLLLSGLTIFASAQARKSRAESSRAKMQNSRSSSEETSAERDRRLYRECQGRPNSGACAGFTQPPPSGRRR